MNAVSEKQRIRFNLIDLLIIFTVLALIVSIVMRQHAKNALSGPEEQISVEVEFLIQKLSSDLFNSIVIGDTVMTDAEQKMGVLKSADFQKSETYYTGSDGVPVLTFSDQYYDVRCVLTAEGTQSDRGFLLGGESYLAPGQNLRVKTPHFTADILITDISVIK